jgi:hypothetical protein
LAGLTLGIDNTVRVVALPLMVVLLLWLLLGSGGTWRRRLLAAAASLLCMACVLTPYVIVQHKHTGYWGLTTPAGAWNLYSRVAPFANCSKFTPPPGTSVLCESTPPSQRITGVEQYTFDAALSPADRAFGNGAGPFWASQASDKKIAAWTRAVILLGYESHSRAHGVLMAVLMLLTFFAPFLPKGRARQIGVLCFAMAWVALITPVASHAWDARAAIPPLGPVGAAAALGLWQSGRLGRTLVGKRRRLRKPAFGRPLTGSSLRRARSRSQPIIRSSLACDAWPSSWPWLWGSR